MVVTHKEKNEEGKEEGEEEIGLFRQHFTQKEGDIHRLQPLSN